MRAGLALEPAAQPCLHSSGGPGQGQESAQALTSGLTPKPGRGGTSLAAAGQSCWCSQIMLAKAELFSVGCWSASCVSQEILPSLGCSHIAFYSSGAGITHVLRIHFQTKHTGHLCRKLFCFLTCCLPCWLCSLQRCLLAASETQSLSLRGRYQGQSCLIPVGSQLDTMPWNPANLNGLCGFNQS